MPPITNEALRELLGPVVEGLGYELDGLSVTPAGRRRVVRVTVDGDTPVDLDTVADISRALGSALDDANALGSTAYVLEVGSPGVERPLTEARHWRRAVGRLVEVSPPAGAGAAFTGRLVAVAETSVTLDVEGVTREVGWSAIDRARVHVEFRRPDGPPGADGAAGAEDDDGVGDDQDDELADDEFQDDDEDQDHGVGDEPDRAGREIPGHATGTGHGGGGATWTST